MADQPSDNSSPTPFRSGYDDANRGQPAPQAPRPGQSFTDFTNERKGWDTGNAGG